MYAESYANCATSHPTPVVTILGTNDFESLYDGITYQGTLYYHSSKTKETRFGSRGMGFWTILK